MTDMTLTDIEIRPFRDEDRPAIVALRNQDRPWFRRETVAEWERQDAKRPPGEVYRRFCVGEPAIAFLDVSDRSTSAWRRPGVCQFRLVVGHAHRRQGSAARSTKRRRTLPGSAA